MLSTLQRLAAAQALRDAVLNEAASPEGDVKRRVALHKRAESLRAVLLGRSAGSMDLFDVNGSVAALSERLAAVKASGDAVDLANTAGYVRILGNRLRQIANLTGELEESIKADNLTASVSDAFLALQSKPHQVAMAERYLAGTGAQMVDAALAEADAGLTPEEVKRATIALNLRIERDRLEQAYAMNRQVYGEQRERLKTEYEAGRLSQAEYLQGMRIVDGRSAEIVKQINIALTRKFGDEAVEWLSLADVAPQKNIAQKLIDGLAAASPVSAQQAADWAKAQEVTASAKAALKRIGYAHEDLRADVAQFYRLTGGRLASVRIKASAGRASATEIHGHKNRTINMGSGFCKRTLFHELGHHLEADPQVFAAARGFLMKRRESDKLYTLRALTGNPRYRRDEVAYKDSWTSPYVGKHYPYDVTEVMSMGMEAFSSPEVMAQVVREDPEHVKLIAGFLTASQDPLFEAVKQVFAQQADAEEDIAEASDKVIEKSLKELAVGVDFTKLDPAPDYYMPGMVYAGSWISAETSIALYEGKARDPVTKRLRKGFRLVAAPTGGHWRSTVAAFSMDEAKAHARVFAREGRFISDLATSAQTVTKMAASYGAAT